MQLYLDDALHPYFNKYVALFDQIMALKGEVYRDLDGRKTQRVKIGEHHFFIKQHRGIGFKEIAKNLIQGRLPVTSAENEWLAIHLLQRLGIDTPTVVGYGERGWNPAAHESFVLLEEIAPSESLETLTADWLQNPLPVKEKWRLIEEVARIARIMHENGINHRDFYLCHFLKRKNKSPLCLIDLHRAQIRRKTPSRWLIKDLAGLYFSSRDIGLTKRDEYRFMCAYRQNTLRNILAKESIFWQKVRERGEKLYREHNK